MSANRDAQLLVETRNTNKKKERANQIAKYCASIAKKSKAFASKQTNVFTDDLQYVLNQLKELDTFLK